MSENCCADGWDASVAEEIAQKLLDAGLGSAAEAFGAEIDAKERVAVDAAPCSAEEFYRRVLKIADITGDQRLAENARKKMDHPDLDHPPTPLAIHISQIYSERFYSYWQDGKQCFIKTEISDLPDWYDRSRKAADTVFTPDELENIIVISCARDHERKAPLLSKLLDTVLDCETVRLGYLYPDRDMARRILDDFLQKLKELLTIRELHDSALQIGEHPEELIPYVWANIIKNLLTRQMIEALDNINALAYLHYAAEKTESITGTAAYHELKTGLLFFGEGRQCRWPNELRKVFMEPTMVEALLRYRFTHGLPAVNTALAYLCAESGEGPDLEQREEDAVVLNSLLLTQTGYLRSSGIHNAFVREKFLKDVCDFKSLKNAMPPGIGARFFHWREELKAKRTYFEKALGQAQERLAAAVEEKSNLIRINDAERVRREALEDAEDRSLVQKLWKRPHKTPQPEGSKDLEAEIRGLEREVEIFSEMHRLQTELLGFVKNIKGLLE